MLLLCVKGGRVLICQLDLTFLVVKWTIQGMKNPARQYPMVLPCRKILLVSRLMPKPRDPSRR